MALYLWESENRTHSIESWWWVHRIYLVSAFQDLMTLENQKFTAGARFSRSLVVLWGKMRNCDRRFSYREERSKVISFGDIYLWRSLSDGSHFFFTVIVTKGNAKDSSVFSCELPNVPFVDLWYGTEIVNDCGVCECHWIKRFFYEIRKMSIVTMKPRHYASQSWSSKNATRSRKRLDTIASYKCGSKTTTLT